MAASIIRIRQKGYTRSTGFQLVNWVVTVPVADPGGSPLIATSPTLYQPLFVVRDVGGFEVFARVAKNADLGEIDQHELRYFEPRGLGGDVLFAPQIEGGPPGPFAGDELAFAVPHWTEDMAPYDTQVFPVLRSVARAEGSAPTVLPGNKLVLSDYTFKSSDVDSWVYLSGFATSGNNGLARILAVVGNVAVINKTVVTSQVGGAWQFPRVEINTRPDLALEPKFFPTKESDVAWSLRRSGVTILERTSGGFTSRGIVDAMARTLRYTAVLGSAALARDVAVAIRNGVYNFSQSTQLLDTDFINLTTTTFGD